MRDEKPGGDLRTLFGTGVPTEIERSPVAGIRTFCKLPYHPLEPERALPGGTGGAANEATEVETIGGADLVVCGVPFDLGVTYRSGARFGPEAIRRASALLRAYNPKLGVAPFAALRAFDVGDVLMPFGYLQPSLLVIAEAAERLFGSGAVPIFLGGDHTISFPLLLGAARVHGPVALIHFDSHSDTWDGPPDRPFHHGTPFRDALEQGCLDVEHSIQVGMRGSLPHAGDIEMARGLGFDLVTMDEFRVMGLDAVAERIGQRVGDRLAFVSFDIDFVDPAFAPATGTPEVGGPSSGEAIEIVTRLRGLNLVGFDVVEVLPAIDPAEVTAYVAANVAYQFASLVAVALDGR